MIWSEDADALLIKLWDEGGSLAFVAAGMKEAGYDVTRNAVAGRRHRLIPQAFVRKKSDPTKTIKAKPISKKEKPMKTSPPPPPPPKKTVTIADVDAIARHQGIDYLDQGPMSCRAILSDKPRSGPWQLQKVCGLPRLEGSPYCRAHTMLYTPPQPIRRHG